MNCSDKEQRPRDSDPLGIYKAPCVGMAGLIQVKPPVFTPVVINGEDNIWRDDDYRPVVEENNSVYVIDNA
jgi:hypothetical protein